jgi:hypothetical protein
MTSARYCLCHRSVMDDDGACLPGCHYPTKWLVVDVTLPETDPHFVIYNKGVPSGWLKELMDGCALHREGAVGMTAAEAVARTRREVARDRDRRRKERRQRKRAERQQARANELPLKSIDLEGPPDPPCRA